MLPRLEAYKEIVDRKADSPMSPKRAEELVFMVTEDLNEAQRAYSQVKFATTPLE